jgi:hypothetical protein
MPRVKEKETSGHVEEGKIGCNLRVFIRFEISKKTLHLCAYGAFFESIFFAKRKTLQRKWEDSEGSCMVADNQIQKQQSLVFSRIEISETIFNVSP